MADQVFAVNSGFYDAVNSDRTYSADDMNRPYKRVVSNGVFATPKGTKSTDLQVVSANSGMQIIVKKGEGIFADKWFENPAAINITVPANTSTVPRIDSVIVQVDKRTSGRVGNIVYRTGTPSVNPVAPSINTVANVIEYRLANVRVETGTTAITAAMITDRRGSSDCPWVTSLIYQVDTSVLYDQWAAAYEEYFEAEKAMWDDWYSHLTEELDVSMTLIKHTSTFVTTQETSEITIGISDFNANTDMLEVYINGMRAIEGSQYTINGNTSIILSAPLGVGQTVNFVCLKSVIMGNPDDITHVIEALEERIASITGGVPTVVDSASAMTDTDKIYILTTDSKWYYYNLTSSAWVAGGVYGGVPTDTTLTQAGMAADAKVVGDEIGDLMDYEYTPITGTDESGKTINSTANVVDATTSYHCVTYAISGGDRVRISGSASAHGYYYIFTDGSTTLKTSNVNDSSAVTSIVDVIDTAPDEASYLIVSYNQGTAYKNASAEKMTRIGLKGIKELNERVSVLEGLTDIAENITPVPQDAITIVDNYYTSITSEHIASAMWRYAMYAIPSGTEGLQVTAMAGQNARLWMLLDSSDSVLEMSSYSGTPVTLTETINLSDYPTASKVIVNDKKSTDLAISVVDYYKVIDGHDVYVDGKALPSILDDHPDDKMYGKIICACGDSITFGADMDADGIVQTSNIDVYQSNGSGVFSKTTANFRKTWNYIIASRHNMTLYNAGVSGSTMQAISERAGFSISNGRYTKLPDNLDYLLIWFGWNDTAYGTLGTIEDSTNESYYGGYNVVLPYLIDKYPYAKIGLIVPFGTDEGHRNAIRQLGNKWGVAVWDNYQGGTPLYYGKEDSVGVDANIVTENRAKYQALGAHPNFKGHTQLADMIEEWMKGI